jgi:hypothetical protein
MMEPMEPVPEPTTPSRPLPSLEETYDFTLLELLEVLGDLDAVRVFFPQHHFRVLQSREWGGAFGLKYIEGNRLWRPRWAREARGRFYVFLDRGRVCPLKDAPERGIEVCYGQVAQTQDAEADPASWARFDDFQQEVLRLHAGVHPLPRGTALSAKVDGSLVIVNVYPADAPQYEVMRAVVEAKGSELARAIAAHCTAAGRPVVTVSTQGTLLLGADMEGYFTTAAAEVLEGGWSVEGFCGAVLAYHARLGLPGMVNLCFEAVCRHRTTAAGREHTELAVGYDRSMFLLLGACHAGAYHPHFDLPPGDFPPPAARRIDSTAETFAALAELDRLVLGGDTDTDVHPEGLVLLVPVPSGAGYRYFKVKTPLYYAAHNIRDVPAARRALALPAACARYYPQVAALHTLSASLGPRVHEAVAGCTAALRGGFDASSPLCSPLPDKARAHVTKASGASPAPGDLAIACKVVLGNRVCHEGLVGLLGPVLQAALGVTDEGQLRVLVLGGEGLGAGTRQLLMKVEPWREGWEGRLQPEEFVAALYLLSQQGRRAA